MDFEYSTMQAIVMFFHLCQSISRRLQELGLEREYETNVDFKHLFFGFLDVPLDNVFRGMMHIQGITPDIPGSEDLVNYFDCTYVTGTFRPIDAPDNINRIQCIPPRFPPRVWNLHENLLDVNPRTNNECEGWNNRFRNLVGHLTIWRLIKTLQKEQALTEILIAQSIYLIDVCARYLLICKRG